MICMSRGTEGRCATQLEKRNKNVNFGKIQEILTRLNMNECLTTPQHEKQIGYWVSDKWDRLQMI